MMACACTSSELEWFQKGFDLSFHPCCFSSVLCFQFCFSEQMLLWITVNLYYGFFPFSIHSPLLSYHISWSWRWYWNLRLPWTFSVAWLQRFQLIHMNLVKSAWTSFLSWINTEMFSSNNVCVVLSPVNKPHSCFERYWADFVPKCVYPTEMLLLFVWNGQTLQSRSSGPRRHENVSQATP